MQMEWQTVRTLIRLSDLGLHCLLRPVCPKNLGTSITCTAIVRKSKLFGFYGNSSPVGEGNFPVCFPVLTYLWILQGTSSVLGLQRIVPNWLERRTSVKGKRTTDGWHGRSNHHLSSLSGDSSWYHLILESWKKDGTHRDKDWPFDIGPNKKIIIYVVQVTAWKK